MGIGFASNSSIRQATRGSTLGTATSSFAGVVRVDGVSIFVDQNGVLSVPVIPVATTGVAGTVKPDGTSIAISGGLISIATSSNGFGVRTVSTSAPSGGSDGDIWYQV